MGRGKGANKIRWLFSDYTYFLATRGKRFLVIPFILAFYFLVVSPYQKLIKIPSLLLHFRYSGYFEDFPPYKQSKQYWQVIAGRLAFVFVFQFTVYVITSFIAWLVPDVPKNLELKEKREKHLTKETFKKKGHSNDYNDHYNQRGDDVL